MLNIALQIVFFEIELIEAYSTKTCSVVYKKIKHINVAPLHQSCRANSAIKACRRKIFQFWQVNRPLLNQI